MKADLLSVINSQKNTSTYKIIPNSILLPRVCVWSTLNYFYFYIPFFFKVLILISKYYMTLHLHVCHIYIFFTNMQDYRRTRKIDDTKPHFPSFSFKYRPKPYDKKKKNTLTQNTQ